MSQSLLLVGLFVAVVACLPFLLRQLQGRLVAAGGGAIGGAKVLSAVAVGPQQRVVTVQVGAGDREVVLVLGVTTSAVSCLHKWTSEAVPGGDAGRWNKVSQIQGD